MPGHGTVMNTTSGQDDAMVCVDNNDGSRDYSTGEQAAVNLTGGTLNQGDVVEVKYDGQLQVTVVGNPAVGNVDADGTSITITDSGDTALSGTVNISTEYGENEGFAEAQGVNCGNVDGKAAYLSE